MSPVGKGPWLAAGLSIGAGILVGLASCSSRQELPLLEPGATVSSSPSEGECRWAVDLEAGEVLFVMVDQLGFDVAVDLRAASGATISTVDSPNGAWAPEKMWWRAPESGRWVLAVRAAGPPLPGGHFRLGIEHSSLGDDPRLRFRVAASEARSRALSASAPEASELFERASQLWLAADEKEEAIHSFIESAVRYQRLAQEKDERRVLDTALELARSPDLDRGPDLEMRILRLLGGLLGRQGDRRSARLFEEAALELAESHKNLSVQASCYNNLGLIETEDQNPRGALLLYRRALLMARELGDSRQAAIVLQNLGVTYGNLGKLDLAVASLEESCDLTSRFGDESHLASCRFQLAWVYHLDGRDESALEIFGDLAEWSRKARENRLYGTVLDRTGTILQSGGRLAEARGYFVEALAESRQRDNRQSQAHALMNLAEVDLSLDQIEQAAQDVAAAMALLDFPGLEDPQGKAHVYSLESRVLARQGRWEEAIGRSSQALALIEELRERAEIPSLTMTFFATRREYLNQQIELLLELFRRGRADDSAQKAFETFDFGQARSLIETLAAANQVKRIDSREQHQVGNRLDQVVQQPQNARPGEIERLLDDWMNLRSAPATSLPNSELANLETLLGDETLLLAFHIADEKVEAFSRRGKSLEVVRLKVKADEIAAEVEQILELAPETRRKLAGERFELACLRLSAWLLKPLELRFVGVRRIVVVTEGPLLKLPLALLDDPLTGRDLVESYETVRSPSAATLLALRLRAAGRPAVRGLALIADPAFDPGENRVGDDPARRASISEPEAELPFDGTRLVRLPASGEEARAIARLWTEPPVWLGLGAQAEERSLLDGRLRKFRIVHFATHSVLDARRPELSGLALSTPTSTTAREDGLLRAYEIAGSEYSADLVVLNACRSAIGKEIAGEGLMGLPRAFLDAGATSVLTSLWPVDDQAGAAFMEAFYLHLAGEPRSRAAALRAAQLELRENPRWVRPYYWAGYELLGDWEILQPEKKAATPQPSRVGDPNNPLKRRSK